MDYYDLDCADASFERSTNLKLYMSRNTFYNCFWSYLYHLLVPKLSAQGIQCSLCENVKISVWDGTAIGVLLRNQTSWFKGFFNSNLQQKRFIAGLFKNCLETKDFDLIGRNDIIHKLRDLVSNKLSNHNLYNFLGDLRDLRQTNGDASDRAIYHLLQDLNPIQNNDEIYKLPLHLKGIIQGISAKSLPPMFGDHPAILAYTCIMLSKGLPLTSKLPEILASILSPIDIDLISIKNQIYVMNEIEINNFKANIAKLFYSDTIITNVDINDYIDDYFDLTKLQTSLLKQLKYDERLRNLLCRAPDQFSIIFSDTKLSFPIMKMFPAMASYFESIQNYGNVPDSMKPLLLLLGNKIWDTWLRPVSYVYNPQLLNDKPFYFDNALFRRCKESYDPSKISADDFNAAVFFTLSDIVSIRNNNTNQNNQEILDNIYDCIKESYEYIDIKLNEDLMNGHYYSNQKLRKCKISYLTDHINNNQSCKRQTFEQRYCDKSFPVHKSFSHGMMINMCPHGCCHGGSFMDAAESVCMIFDILFGRGDDSKYVIYDNACHLHLYCMLREPSYFWAIIFVIDKFHEVNHISCSYSYFSTKRGTDVNLNINSQVNEQFNSVFGQDCNNLQMMTLEHAILYFIVYIHLKNTASKREFNRNAVLEAFLANLNIESL